MKNLHAVLVHESRECVVDLVRNLHHLDPVSSILLYNGGKDPELLRASFPWERYNAVVHPAPRPLKWGWLHDFALDCMRFGLEEMPFDTMTIVDSDQLGLGAGYSEFLGAWLSSRKGVGMLGSAPPPNGRPNLSPPAVQAMKELDLWRPFLRRFEKGESKFVHWTFWPTTVFTADAARALLETWPDSQLQEILGRTKIWASEEVILPTLVALLGFEVALNPCRHDYVRYRVRYSTAQMDAGINGPDTFWVHPVSRRYDDALRAHVRRRLGNYEAAEGGAPVAHLDERRSAGPIATLPILSEIRPIEGWLSDEEADLLIATAAHALRGDDGEAIVEVGSFCGKATVALARVVQLGRQKARVVSIDPHDGVVGSRDGALSRHGPTRSKLDAHLQHAGLSNWVDVKQSRSVDVAWEGAIRLLLVDGLHDYESVATDFHHFEPWVAADGYVAFHDYADYFPGVRLFVNELLRSGAWSCVRVAGSLVVLRRRDAAAGAPAEPLERTAGPGVDPPAAPVAAAPTHAVADVPAMMAGALSVTGPRVTCIMPTANRRQFVARAIRAFEGQTYRDRELVIVDDGADGVEDLVPEGSPIRYIRLAARRSVGEKRNIACRAATGAIVVHWDDDDWSAPWRVAYQVEEMEREGATIAGLDAVYYYHLGRSRGWQYRYPPSTRQWASGNTLAYRRERWEAHAFPDLNVGEDTRFLWSDRSARLRVHPDPRFFVGMLHESNVSEHRVEHRFWHAQAAETIRGIMGAELEAFEALAHFANRRQAG